VIVMICALAVVAAVVTVVFLAANR